MTKHRVRKSSRVIARRLTCLAARFLQDPPDDLVWEDLVTYARRILDVDHAEKLKTLRLPPFRLPRPRGKGK